MRTRTLLPGRPMTLERPPIPALHPARIPRGTTASRPTLSEETDPDVAHRPPAGYHPSTQEVHVTSRVALVTGAGTGIGKTVALAFLKDGFRVVLAGRRREPLLATIEESGVSRALALAVSTDVTQAESVNALF